MDKFILSYAYMILNKVYIGFSYNILWITDSSYQCCLRKEMSHLPTHLISGLDCVCARIQVAVLLLDCICCVVTLSFHRNKSFVWFICFTWPRAFLKYPDDLVDAKILQVHLSFIPAVMKNSFFPCKWVRSATFNERMNGTYQHIAQVIYICHICTIVHELL